jgi:uncharacterized membrane protein YfcA
LDNLTTALLLAATGVVAGTLNVIAGGGSFLTLPILIFLGLPPSVANGTNRVGILVQNIGALWSFNRHGMVDWRWVLRGALPASGGAVAGTYAALIVGDEAFKKILALLMVAITLWTIAKPLEPGQPSEETSPRHGLLALGFTLVGFYGGFVQAGVGFLVLAATTIAGLDLVRGNAVKVLSILAFTIISLLLFALNGKVDWLLGSFLAVGTLVGGQLGVRFTVLKGHRWVQRVVTAAIIIFAIKLWL